MFKIIFLVKKRSDMSRKAYQAYSTNTHGPLTCGLPGLKKYVINYAQPSDSGDPLFDGMVELWFDNLSDFERALASDQGQKALADQQNFLDTSQTRMLPVEEIALV
tara:strand:- start:18 stop:335 length:318 start_codon:yes stop_codon:yes gene_type:complete